MASVFRSSPIMTVNELSTYLHVHKSTVYRLIKGGEIPGAFRMGSDWRFNREQIDRWRLGLTAEGNSPRT
jgi:excisionase family DNA binding protein